MWATNGQNIRHFFGRGTEPVAACGYEAKHELDYTRVHLPCCLKCKDAMEVMKGEGNGKNHKV